jgi:hypothetical protein
VSEIGSENPIPSPSFISAVSRSIDLSTIRAPRGTPREGLPEASLYNFEVDITQMYTEANQPVATDRRRMDI